MSTHRKVAKNAEKNETQVLKFFARCRFFAVGGF